MADLSFGTCAVAPGLNAHNTPVSSAAGNRLSGRAPAALAMLLAGGLLTACGMPGANQAAHEQVRAKRSDSHAAAAHVVAPATAPAPVPVAAVPMAEAAPMARLAAMQAPAGEARRASRDRLVQNTERYDTVKQNPVKLTAKEAVSTLSLDVDTGAYTNVRRFLKQGQLPPADAVRVEEMVNYFPFDYQNKPVQGAPFGVSTEVAPAPWNAKNLLLRVGVKAVDRQSGQMPPANLVFLVDVSGSMNSSDKLPLVQTTLRLLTEQLRPQDRVSIVTYSGKEELALPATNDKQKILAVVNSLSASGATSGASALAMAYEQARAAFIPGSINRIVLATDGDFNVGVASVDQLKSAVARERSSGISLTTLGFGTGNYNEPMMQQLAQVGNGNYSYIDSATEARKVLVEELSSTFNTVAADVKLQLEFNPATVAEWRLIGYENRLLDEADFRNDQVDAVEIGAGKSVTALYELTPVGQPTLHGASRYQVPRTVAGRNNEFAEVRIRFKQPGAKQAREVTLPVPSRVSQAPSTDWRFAAAVAGFGQLLQGGTHLGNWTYADALRLAQAGRGDDPQGYRGELAQLIAMARDLSPKAAPAGHVQAPQ